MDQQTEVFPYYGIERNELLMTHSIREFQNKIIQNNYAVWKMPGQKKKKKYIFVYKILENTNKSRVTESTSVVDWGQGMGQRWGKGMCGKTYKKGSEGHKEILGGDRYIYYLDYGDGFVSLYISHNLSNCIYMSSLLYDSNTSIKLFFSKERKCIN